MEARVEPELVSDVVNPTLDIISFPSKKMPKQYESLVYSRWLRSLRYGNPLFKKSNSDQYYKEYHKYLEVLLDKPDSIVRMAVLSDDHDVVIGFSVCREDVIDYIHVHGDHRKCGIGKQLLPPKYTAFTHATLTALKIWQENEKYKKLEFKPFA